jgi:hypothetical protein
MNRFIRSAVFSAFASCLAAPALAALPDSGMWAIEGELNGKPGRGIQIDRQSGLNVIVTYYGYRTDGSALFLQAAGQLKDEKIFEGELTEYRGGRVLGGPAQNGEVVHVVGPVRIVFDTETSASITLPGEATQVMKRFRFEDHLSRLTEHGFSYLTTREMVYEAKPRSISVYAKDGIFRMNEAFESGRLCFYEGNFEMSGPSLNSEGNVTCEDPSSRPGISSYKIQNLQVDEYGVLTGRFNWSGWDSTGKPLSTTDSIVGTCRFRVVFLGPNPCLNNGNSFYTKQN